MRAVGKRLHPQRIRRTFGAASCVRESARFVVNELRDVPMTRQYRLRTSGLRAQVRHPLLDMWLVEETFRFRTYEPPAEVVAALDRLGRPIRIADLGGHVGFFGLFVHQSFPVADVVSFEPDPDNARLLMRCIEANGLQERWRVVEACAATGEGVVEFASSYHLSRMAPASERPLDEMQRRITSAFPFMEGTALVGSEHRQVASVDVFPFLADVDLVKMDIEGTEWEILADGRFAELDAAAVVLEYHPTYAPEPDAEALVMRELARAGFEVGAPVRGWDAGLIWAWRDPGRSS
jgi:FkbM family methyltransferase